MQEIEELAGIAGKKLNDVHLTKCLDEELSSETSHKSLLFWANAGATQLLLKYKYLWQMTCNRMDCNKTENINNFNLSYRYVSETFESLVKDWLTMHHIDYHEDKKDTGVIITWGTRNLTEFEDFSIKQNY